MVELAIVFSIIFISETRSEQGNRSIILVLKNFVGCLVGEIHSAFIGITAKAITSYIQFLGAFVFEVD